MATANRMTDFFEGRKTCKMMPLGKYNLDNRETYPQFLQRFEDYARAMFPDPSIDGWSHHLGSYVEDIKKVYDILYKNTKGYENLRQSQSIIPGLSPTTN